MGNEREESGNLTDKEKERKKLPLSPRNEDKERRQSKGLLSPIESLRRVKGNKSFDDDARKFLSSFFLCCCFFFNSF